MIRRSLAIAILVTVVSCGKPPTPPLALQVLHDAQVVDADRRNALPADPNDSNSYAIGFSSWKFYVHTPYRTVVSLVASDPLVAGRYVRKDGPLFAGDPPLQCSFDLPDRRQQDQVGAVGIRVYAGKFKITAFDNPIVAGTESDWTTIRFNQTLSRSKGR